MAPGRPAHVHQCCGGPIAFNFRMEEKAEETCRLLDCFFLGLLFDREDGGSTILRNVCELLPDHTPSHPRLTVLCIATNLRTSNPTGLSGFSSVLRASPEIVPQIRPRPPPSEFLPIHDALAILLFDTIHSELLTASLS
jgi:hypothetical protein